MPVIEHRALYAAFDRFPSRKGAAVHIDRFARALFDVSGGGLLYVLGGDDYPAHQIEDGVEIVRFSTSIPNFLDRTVAFGKRLAALLDERAGTLDLCHFRDPWSGVPILARPRSYRAIYEVNALPSIELPYFYRLGAPTLRKIEELERFCLDEADAIVVPSQTIADFLVSRDVPNEKITVIRNGADLDPTASDREEQGDYLIYFGALQPWQGVDDLIRAFSLLRDLTDLRLVICASQRTQQAKIYRKFAEKKGVSDRITWRFALTAAELAPIRNGALMSIAPLKECSRNVVQGCAPIKIVESMAAGVPVIASDLAPVREVITDNVDGRLVRPDRPSELARVIRLLLDHRQELRRLGENARARVARGLTWNHAIDQLHEVYRKERHERAQTHS